MENEIHLMTDCQSSFVLNNDEEKDQIHINLECVFIVDLVNKTETT
jgi:hypothetical protein